ncbi:MAG: hypothetical protein Q8R95_02035, partial [Azonexus sp.]|nr:hypothetical protein [Azonexus sp.]
RRFFAVKLEPKSHCQNPQRTGAESTEATQRGSKTELPVEKADDDRFLISFSLRNSAPRR